MKNPGFLYQLGMIEKVHSIIDRFVVKSLPKLDFSFEKYFELLTLNTYNLDGLERSKQKLQVIHCHQVFKIINERC